MLLSTTATDKMPPKAKPKAKVGAAAPKAKAGAAPKAGAKAAAPAPPVEEPYVPIDMEAVLGVLKPAAEDKTVDIPGMEAAIKKAEETLADIDKKLKIDKFPEGVTAEQLTADKTTIEGLLKEMQTKLVDRKEVETILKTKENLSVDYVDRTAEFYYGVESGKAEDCIVPLIQAAL